MEAIDCYLSFAKQTGNEHTIISAYLIHGLHRVHHQLYSHAIKDFSEVACLADYLHSRHYAALLIFLRRKGFFIERSANL